MLFSRDSRSSKACEFAADTPVKLTSKSKAKAGKKVLQKHQKMRICMGADNAVYREGKVKNSVR